MRLGSSVDGLHGVHRRSAWLVIGSATGGGALGLVLLVVGRILETPESLRVGILLGITTLSVAALYSRTVRRYVPDRPRQLKESLLLTRTPSQVAALWGFDLGLGLRTLIVTPAIYAFVAVAALQPSWIATLGVCLLYGVTRGLAVATFMERSQRRSIDLVGAGLNARMKTPLALAAILAALLTMLTWR
jgi:hypothetical protein